ncbi:hypothetical protein AAVH_07467 [Aphelenchoides avenae]|nr:hypothetical protein AAVH_07467 [Aphelenchus avenae]
MDQITNTEGTVATVICDAGSKLVGPGSAVCSNGEWSVGDIGQCKPLACPRLQEIPNGKLEYINAKSETLNPQMGIVSPGTTARLKCLGKGKLVGARESQCNASEKWDPTIGTCK